VLVPDWYKVAVALGGVDVETSRLRVLTFKEGEQKAQAYVNA
jgi:hypothetical protein